MKYRKEPVVIDAIHYIANAEGINAITDFVPSDILRVEEPMNFFIKTLEGEHIVSNGDYIIKGVAGEFYPCKPDIFEKTYKIAE